MLKSTTNQPLCVLSRLGPSIQSQETFWQDEGEFVHVFTTEIYFELFCFHHHRFTHHLLQGLLKILV